MNGGGQTTSATPGLAGPSFLKALEDLLIALRRSSKDLAFYPSGHPMLTRSLENAVRHLRAAVAVRTPLALTVSRNGFGFEGQPVGKENRQLATMAAELFVRRIRQIFFAQQIEMEELAAFLQVIASDPKHLIEQGGPSKILAVRGVSRIQVGELEFRRVGGTAATIAHAGGPAGRATGVPSQVRATSPASLQADESAAGPERVLSVSPGKLKEVVPPAPTLSEDTVSSASSKELTIEALIERLEREATSGEAAGYDRAASRLEQAAGQAVHDDQLRDLLKVFQVFLRHRQADSLGAPLLERAGRAVETISGGRTVPYLVEHLWTETGEVAEELSTALVGLGSKVIPGLLGRVAREDWNGARERIVATLARCSEAAPSDLTQALQALNGDQASHIARMLGEVGSASAADLLAVLLRHQDAQVRGEALRGLGRIDEPTSHRLLVQALRDPDADVVELAIGLVGAAKLKSATPTLLRLAGQRILSGKAFAVRKAALAALGAIGEPGTASTLSEILHARTWFQRMAGDDLRLTAALALLAMARPEAREVVAAGARSWRRDVRRACTAALRTVAAAPAKG